MLAGRGVHLGALTSVLARRYGDRPAVAATLPIPGLDRGSRWTFSELEDATARLAGAQRAAGVGEGSVVLVAVANRIDALLHLLAAARLGAVACPVNPRLKPQEFDAIVEAAGGTAAILDRAILERLTSGRPWSGPRLLIADGAVDDAFDIAGALGTVAGVPVTVDRSPDDVVLNLCTSGTTGTPKAAALTSVGLVGGPGRIRLPFGRPRPDGSARFTLLAALPLYHVMGIGTALGTLCAGAELLLRETFDAVEILTLLEAGRARAFVGVPTMYADLEAAGAERRNLSKVQLWMSGADAMPPDRARRFQRAGAVATIGRRRLGTAAFIDIYGMVELSGGAAMRIYPFSIAARLKLSVPAVVLPGIKVRAVDDRGKPLGWGRPGELQFRGKSVLREYRGRADAGPDADGWFATGDYGRVFPGGTFLFSGRSRDRLKVAGFSVFPAEVEEALAGHPDVAEIALVGLPDERLGDRPVAVVVPRHSTFPEEAFLRWAHERVAGYRRPREVFVVSEIPRGSNGKIDRLSATRLAVDAARRA
jgi:acyl-CoA synthetase (AMP-forming)/AMP-acid ligase II